MSFVSNPVNTVNTGRLWDAFKTSITYKRCLKGVFKTSRHWYGMVWFIRISLAYLNNFFFFLRKRELRFGVFKNENIGSFLFLYKNNHHCHINTIVEIYLPSFLKSTWNLRLSKRQNCDIREIYLIGCLVDWELEISWFLYRTNYMKLLGNY